MSEIGRMLSFGKKITELLNKKLQKLFKSDEGSVACVCKVLLCYGIDYNFDAYDVFWTKKLAFVIINDLVSPFPAILGCMGNGTMFATVKHKI